MSTDTEVNDCVSMLYVLDLMLGALLYNLKLVRPHRPGAYLNQAFIWGLVFIKEGYFSLFLIGYVFGL